MKIINLLIFGTVLAIGSGGPTRHFLRHLDTAVQPIQPNQSVETIFCICGGEDTCSTEDLQATADPCGAGCPCCGDETLQSGDLCCDCLDECTSDNIDQVQNPCSAGCPCKLPDPVFCVCADGAACGAEDPCGSGCPCCGDPALLDGDPCCECLDACTDDNLEHVQNPCSAGCPCAPEYIFCACIDGNCNADDPAVVGDPCGAGCLCCDDETLQEGDLCCNCLGVCTTSMTTVEEACSAGCPCYAVENVYCECGGEDTCSTEDLQAMADPCGAGCPCCGDETLQDGGLCCECLDECTSDNIDQVQNPCSAGCPCKPPDPVFCVCADGAACGAEDPCGSGCPCCGDPALACEDPCCECLDLCTSDNLKQVQNPCSAGCPCAE